MVLTFRKLHPHFAAEVGPVDLRTVSDAETLERSGPGWTSTPCWCSATSPSPTPSRSPSRSASTASCTPRPGSVLSEKSRFGNEALADISNVDENGEILKSDDRRRMYGLGNRLWHTDASFQDPPGRYSMLSARMIPPVGADTEFADMRAAYDAARRETKAQIEGLRVHHSIAYSRQTLGFEFSQEEEDKLKGAVHPLVRTIPRARPALALPGLARLADHRLAGARGATAAARPDRARDPAGVRLPPRAGASATS